MEASKDFDVQVVRYRINRLFCWHSKDEWRLETSNNGVVAYCSLCGRKKIGIYDFGIARWKVDD